MAAFEYLCCFNNSEQMIFVQKKGFSTKLCFVLELGGALKCFLFSPLLGEDFPFDSYFQMGWFNHQPGKNILSINYLNKPVQPGPVVVDSSRRPSLGELSQGDFAYGDEGGGGYQTPGPVETQTEIHPREDKQYYW